MDEKKLNERIREIAWALDDGAFLALHDAVMKTGAKFVRHPETGLLMMELKDTFDTGFYLGEVLITEAMAELNGQQGYAMVIGDSPVKAGVFAVLEALEKSPDKYPGVINETEKELEKLENAAGKSVRTENAFISSTRVNFESMRKG
jgi:alpha-D-ribose 1-methylphosphonate 5-triphosphate synthase subunit PhnG